MLAGPISIDSDTLLVVPIAIGIAIDDTIHFLMHFRSEMKDGKSVEESGDFLKKGRAGHVLYHGRPIHGLFRLSLLGLYTLNNFV